MIADIRDTIFNKLMVWLMKHCTCHGSTFYALCEQYSFNCVSNLFNCYRDYKLFQEN